MENSSPPYPGNAGQQLTRPQLSLLLVDAREEARERRRLGASQGQKRENLCYNFCPNDTTLKNSHAKKIKNKNKIVKHLMKCSLRNMRKYEILRNERRDNSALIKHNMIMSTTARSCRCSLAYGGCARGTNGGQNCTVLTSSNFIVD